MTVTVKVMSTVEKKTVTVTMTAVYETDVYSECVNAMMNKNTDPY